MQKYFINSECFNASFAVSPNGHKNLNGILIVNERGTIAETYIFNRYSGNQDLKRKTVLTKMKTAMKQSIEKATVVKMDTLDAFKMRDIDF